MVTCWSKERIVVMYEGRPVTILEGGKRGLRIRVADESLDLGLPTVMKRGSDDAGRRPDIATNCPDRRCGDRGLLSPPTARGWIPGRRMPPGRLDRLLLALHLGGSNLGCFESLSQRLDLLDQCGLTT